MSRNDSTDDEMNRGKRPLSSDLRGLGRLSVSVVAEVTHLVEALHHTILRVPGIVGEEARGPTRGITGLVYRSIRGVNSLVGGTLDGALAKLAPLLGERSATPMGEASQAALNGVLGDYLAATDNPLAIAMRLRSGGCALTLQGEALAAALPAANGKIVLLVHGLCMNDLQWTPASATAPQHASGQEEPRPSIEALLAQELGYTVVHLHYNSGLHISENGRGFAELLEQMIRYWPVPVQELIVVGHSMGGLVGRSACHYAALAHHGWLQHLRALVFLGTPHHGAPLERGGNWVDVILGISPYTAPFARLGKVRSAGITDLRYGNLVDEDWIGRDRFQRASDRRFSVPLPEGVPCYAIAATKSKSDGTALEHLRSDGLVPVASAHGRHPMPGRSLLIPASRKSIGYGIGHLELLSRAEVHQQVLRWLAEQ